MAEIFRPVYTATDPKTGNKIRKKSPRWWIRYYTPDGVRHKVKGYTDKRATQALATELEKEAVHTSEGFANRKLAGKPLLAHLEDYRRHLEAKNNNPRYVS